MTLVAFDFDGTLSDSEMTVLLGARRGADDDMAAITERAMNDEIEYAESLRQRAALLEGLPETDVEAAFEQVELREGASALLQTLSAAGVTTAILTGGFERGVERALESHDTRVDHVIANRLPYTTGDVADGTEGDDGNERTLTGEVEGPLVEGTKDDALITLAEDEDIALERTIAIGDGANDLPMLRVAGLAVGFSPKPAVAPHCDVIVETMAEVEATLRAHGVLEE